MGGEDKPIVPPRLAGDISDLDSLLRPPHPNGGPAAQRAPQALSERADINAAPPDHGSPGRTVGEIEQAVVKVEANERFRRIFANLHCRSGPDRRRHRIQIVIAKGPPVAAPIEIGAKRTEILTTNVLPRLTKESHDIAQHRPIARPQQVGALRDEAAQSGPGIFDSPIVYRNRERHVAFARLDADVSEQGGEVRIGALIVDNKAAIDWRAIPVERVRMAPESRLSFVEGHVARLGKEPCGAEPGNPAADNGDAKRA